MTGALPQSMSCPGVISLQISVSFGSAAVNAAPAGAMRVWILALVGLLLWVRRPVNRAGLRYVVTRDRH